MTRTAIVFAGGDRPSPDTLIGIPDDAYVICADAGLDHAIALGRHADRIVGDLDSANLEAVTTAVAAGSELEEHPADKDATDLELALISALESDIDDVVVVGAHGGRIDHFLANTLLLASRDFAAMQIRAHLDDTFVTVIHSEATLTGTPGDTCSLLAVGADAGGVTTTGLQWPLADGVIPVGSSLGMSNVFVGDVATVSIRSGTLLALQPGAEAPTFDATTATASAPEDSTAKKGTTP